MGEKPLYLIISFAGAPTAGLLCAYVEKNHKDRLFNFIFGREEHKDRTLSLYNVVNGSDYTDPELVDFNTLGGHTVSGYE